MCVLAAAQIKYVPRPVILYKKHIQFNLIYKIINKLEYNVLFICKYIPKYVLLSN